MKYLGTQINNKDMINKGYVDNNFNIIDVNVLPAIDDSNRNKILRYNNKLYSAKITYSNTETSISVGTNLNNALLILSFPNDLYESSYSDNGNAYLYSTETNYISSYVGGTNNYMCCISASGSGLYGPYLYSANTNTGELFTNLNSYILPNNFGTVTEVADFSNTFSVGFFEDISEFIKVRVATESWVELGKDVAVQNTEPTGDEVLWIEDDDILAEDVDYAIAGDTLPVGSQLPYGGATPPENWLICDGSAVSRTTYADLFAVIGTSYGAGDGSTTFNLPNKKGRNSIGLDTSDTDFNAIGKRVGEKTHTHELTSGYAKIIDDGNGNLALKASSDISWSHSVIINLNGSTSYISGQQTYAVDLGGSSNSGNNIQPGEVDQWIIKYGQSAGVVATVVDNLNSTSSTDALSSNMGKELNEKIEQRITTGVEFATNEYIDGKRVYIKQLEFTDTFNSASPLTKAHGIVGATKVWIDSANSHIIQNNACYPLPLNCFLGNFDDQIGLSVNLTELYLYSQTGWNEAWKKVVRLKYVK